MIANNSQFLILPDWHHPNVGSRVLGLLERRIGADWQARFGHPLLLLEIFVDPRCFHGLVYLLRRELAGDWAKPRLPANP